jgi:hypothetical protein
LPLSNIYSRAESFFRWRGILRIAVQQNLAADMEEEGIAPTRSHLIRQCYCSINAAETSLWVAFLSFNLGKEALKKWDKSSVPLFNMG